MTRKKWLRAIMWCTVSVGMLVYSDLPAVVFVACCILTGFVTGIVDEYLFGEK